MGWTKVQGRQYIQSRKGKDGKMEYRPDIAYGYEGKRYRYRTAFDKSINTAAKAEKEALRLKLEFESNPPIPLSIRKKQQEAALTAAKKYITPDTEIYQALGMLREESTEAEGKKIVAIQNYLIRDKGLKPLVKLKLKNFDKQHIDLLKDFLRKKKFRQPTYDQYKSVFSRLLKRAELFNKFDNYTDFKSTEKSTGSILDLVPKHNLTFLQFAKKVYNELKKINDDDLRLICTLSFMTAKRINEIHSLEFSDFDLEKKIVTVRISKQRDGQELEQTIPIPDEVMPMLQKLKKKDRIARLKRARRYSDTMKSIFATVLGISVDDEYLHYQGAHNVRDIAISVMSNGSGIDIATLDSVLLNHRYHGSKVYYIQNDIDKIKKVYHKYWDLLHS